MSFNDKIMSQVESPYCLISWNVDLYNDIIHSWVRTMLENRKPDVLFLSETKQDVDTLKCYFEELNEYNYIINSHQPKRYHGVAMLIRKDRKYTRFELDLKIVARSDTKDGNPVTGRVIVIELEEKYMIVGTYVPNSGNGKDSIRKLPYRVNIWDPALQSLLNVCKARNPTVWLGDINVAIEDLDVSNPKTMCKMAGFRPEERQSIAKIMTSGEWFDIWRLQHPDSRQYSWIGNTPKPGYGMRLDNIIVSNEVVPNVVSTFMIPDCIPNSDHVPVGAYIN